MIKVWILIVFMSGSHGERTASQFGPFVSAAECQEVAAIVDRWTDSDRFIGSNSKPLCKEIRSIQP